MAKISIKNSLKSIKEELLDYSVREKTFLLVESLITIITAIVAMIINFVASRQLIAFATLGFSVAAIGFFVIELFIFTYKRHINNDPFLYFNFLLTYILVVLYLIFAPKSGIHLYWLVSFPLVMTVVGGSRRGIFYSLLLLLIVVLFFYAIPFKDWMIGEMREGGEKDFEIFKIFFILNYVMTLLIGAAVALINDGTIKRLDTLKQEYYHDANTDITTGLKNQMFFLSYVKELPSHLEDGDTIGLMFIDIDDFKLYNDKYGHIVGNEVLVKVANKLNEVPHSLLVRWGGDEFAIIERNMAKDEFVAKANYLLKSVEAAGDGITISIGLAFYTVDENFNFDEIFNEADMKTIRAKGKGKNCIVFND